MHIAIPQSSWWHNDTADVKSVINRFHYPTLHSTQVFAREEVTARRAYFTNTKQWGLITTDTQIAGIGSSLRSWVSPPDVNIYATYIVEFPYNKKDLFDDILQVVTVAIASVVEQIGLTPKIKWINDLLVNNKKICGVLVEKLFIDESSPNFTVLIGIGLNVNMLKDQCDSIDQPVTSLLVESGKQWEKDYVLDLLNESILCTMRDFMRRGFEKAVYPKLSTLMAYIDELIIVKDQSNIFYGIFEGVSKNGGMLLNTGDEILTLSSGRIVKIQ
jgi:BirA family biotin operon repressor/biotin-[acetyl-CoA-carboxylase] ligase